MVNYSGLERDAIDVLKELIGNTYKSFAHNRSDAEYFISNDLRPWMAIFSDYLTKNEQQITIQNDKYYYRQTDLEEAYPIADNKGNILSPFDTVPPSSRYDFEFVDTTTGTKIYDYANMLIEKDIGYTDRPSLAVALTESKSHKVKIIVSNNKVWILSNKLSDEFVDKVLALFPFIFNIQELLQNEKIMLCCEKVSKGETLKDAIQFLLGNLEELRKLKKLKLIKEAINTKHNRLKLNLDSSILECQNQILHFELSIQNKFEEMEEYRLKRIGLETSATSSDEDVKDLLDFIDRNPLIKGIGINTYYYDGEQPQLDIQAPITIYDKEPLERVLQAKIKSNDESEAYMNILKALGRIFIDEELTMYCQTFVSINFSQDDIDGSKDHSQKRYSDFSLMCHPHISRFNCWGDNKNVIRQALREGDIIGAINNILIAVQNINFTDMAVLNSWINVVLEHREMYIVKCCLSKADGQMWSIKDVVEQLKREEKGVPKVKVTEVGHPDLIDDMPF